MYTRRIVFALPLLTGCPSDAPSGDPDADAAPDAAAAPDATPPFTATLTLRNSAGDTANATLVGFRDGDGPWQELTGDDGVYRGQAPTGRFTFVHVCPDDDFTLISMSASTLEEDASLDRASCTASDPVPTWHNVSGTVSNIPTDPTLTIAGYQRTASSDDEAPTYELGVHEGPNQFLAYTVDEAGLLLAMSRHDLGEVDDDVTYDFAAPTAAVPTVALDVTDLPSGQAVVTDTYVNTPDGFFTLTLDRIDDGAHAYALPAGFELPGDTFGLYVSTSGPDGVGGVRLTQSIYQPDQPDAAFATAFTMPATVDFGTATFDATEVLLSWSIPTAAQSADGLGAFVYDFGDSGLVVSVANATPGWLADAASFELGGYGDLPSWLPAWNIEQPSWSIEAEFKEATYSAFAGSEGNNVISPLARVARARVHAVARTLRHAAWRAR